jgi:hypothetical protein
MSPKILICGKMTFHVSLSHRVIFFYMMYVSDNDTSNTGDIVWAHDEVKQLLGELSDVVVSTLLKLIPEDLDDDEICRW